MEKKEKAMTTASRKRVRFEEDDNGENRQVKRRTVEMPFPKSSLLTTEEKALFWMQPADHRHTLEDVLTLMHDCHHPKEDSKNNHHDNDPNKVPFAQYAEALALTFMLCDAPPVVDEDNDDDDEPPLWNIRDSQSVAQLALWASHHTTTRGVESKMLPGLNQERQLRRTKAIQGVLEAQKQLKKSNNNDERAVQLRVVSQALSHSARQFATALAVVDGTQAYLEYNKKKSDTINDDKKETEAKTECQSLALAPDSESVQVRKDTCVSQ